MLWATNHLNISSQESFDMVYRRRSQIAASTVCPHLWMHFRTASALSVLNSAVSLLCDVFLTDRKQLMVSFSLSLSLSGLCGAGTQPELQLVGV